MLTGRVPVGRFKLPSQLNSEVPPEVDPIVLRCLEAQPQDRYATVGKLLRDVRQLEDQLRLGLILGQLGHPLKLGLGSGEGLIDLGSPFLDVMFVALDLLFGFVQLPLAFVEFAGAAFERLEFQSPRPSGWCGPGAAAEKGRSWA